MFVLSSSHKMVFLGQSGNGTWPKGIKVEEYFIESIRSLAQRHTRTGSWNLSLSTYHLPIIFQLSIYLSMYLPRWLSG